MLDQGLIDQLLVAPQPHRPHVVGRDRGHPVELVEVLPDARARLDVPGRSRQDLRRPQDDDRANDRTEHHDS